MKIVWESDTISLPPPHQVPIERGLRAVVPKDLDRRKLKASLILQALHRSPHPIAEAFLFSESNWPNVTAMSKALFNGPVVNDMSYSAQLFFELMERAKKDIFIGYVGSMEMHADATTEATARSIHLVTPRNIDQASQEIRTGISHCSKQIVSHRDDGLDAYVYADGNKQFSRLNVAAPTLVRADRRFLHEPTVDRRSKPFSIDRYRMPEGWAVGGWMMSSRVDAAAPRRHLRAARYDIKQLGMEFWTHFAPQLTQWVTGLNSRAASVWPRVDIALPHLALSAFAANALRQKTLPSANPPTGTWLDEIFGFHPMATLQAFIHSSQDHVFVFPEGPRYLWSVYCWNEI